MSSFLVAAFSRIAQVFVGFVCLFAIPVHSQEVGLCSVFVPPPSGGSAYQIIQQDPIEVYLALETDLESLTGLALRSASSPMEGERRRATLLFAKIAEIGEALNQLDARLMADGMLPAALVKNLEEDLASAKKEFRDNSESSEGGDGGLASSLETVINDPLSVVPEYAYNFEFIDGKPGRVRFTKKVVDDVFSQTDLHNQIIRSLKRMKNGIFFGDYQRDGVIRFQWDKNLFEIRITGKNGNFRFYGYFYGGDLIIDQHTVSSEHNAKLLKDFSDKLKVSLARRARTNPIN